MKKQNYIVLTHTKKISSVDFNTLSKESEKTFKDMVVDFNSRNSDSFNGVITLNECGVLYDMYMTVINNKVVFKQDDFNEDVKRTIIGRCLYIITDAN